MKATGRVYPFAGNDNATGDQKAVLSLRFDPHTAAPLGEDFRVGHAECFLVRYVGFRYAGFDFRMDRVNQVIAPVLAGIRRAGNIVDVEDTTVR